MRENLKIYGFPFLSNTLYILHFTQNKNNWYPSFENSTLHHKITRLGGGAYYKDCQKKFPVKYVTQKLKVIADKEMTIVTW